jgi:hypothetical protein
MVGAEGFEPYLADYRRFNFIGTRRIHSPTMASETQKRNEKHWQQAYNLDYEMRVAAAGLNCDGMDFSFWIELLI